MNLEIQLTKEKLKKKMLNFVNNFNEEEFILNLARYRKKEYFDKAIYKHFEIEVTSYKQKIIQTGLGEKIRIYIQNMDKDKLTQIFEKEKIQYEFFFEKSYFKDIEKLNITYKEKLDSVGYVEKTENFKEKAVMYSILDMSELKEIKKEAITYGQYTNFIELFFEHILPPSLFFIQNNYKIVKNYHINKKDKDFVYSFKTFFRDEVNVNPYYNGIRENGEIVGEFTDKATGTIKKIFFDNYAKKNSITKISQEDIEEVTKEFQEYYRRDKNANKKIINKYFISEVIAKNLKMLSTIKDIDTLIEYVQLEYENYLQIYTRKFPKNFTESVIEFIINKKEDNLQNLSDKVKKEYEFQVNISKIDQNITNSIKESLKIK